MTLNATVLRGQPIVNEDGVASAAVMPGRAVVGVGSIAPGAAKLATFALERDEMGKGVMDPYASGDVVKIGTFHQGHRVLAWVASGDSVAVDDPVVATSAGYMESLGTGTGTVLGRALETISASAGDTHIRIEVG